MIGDELTEFIEARLYSKNPPRDHRAMADHIAKAVMKEYVVLYGNPAPGTENVWREVGEQSRIFQRISQDSCPSCLSVVRMEYGRGPTPCADFWHRKNSEI
jgi:hypothetical protein